MLPVIIIGISHGNYGLGNTLAGHGYILIKSGIVLGSWLLGYASIKHLPLTIAGPVNASRPVLVLVGALVIFGERLNAWQWTGVIIGFWSLFFISRVGGQGGFLPEAQPMGMDGDRCHRTRRSECPLRQIPSHSLRAS